MTAENPWDDRPPVDVIDGLERLSAETPCISNRDACLLLSAADRLRKAPDVPDAFWPLIEAICDQAAGTWEDDDPRTRTISVQIDKRDIDVLRRAYGEEPRYTEPAR